MLIGGLSVQADPLPIDFADAIARVRGRLGELAEPVIFFSTIGSTNDVAAKLAAGGQRGAVVIADAQTAGRGRRGHRWFSPAGAGLYVSTVLGITRADGGADRVTSLVTLAAGVALAEAVERVTGLEADIKWPNDLLVGRRKMAGILAEAIVSDSDDRTVVVLGYGINVGRVSYPQDLGDTVTCLETELGRSVDRARLCAETLAAVAERHRDLIAGRFDAILDAWRERARGCHGTRVSWETSFGPQTGVTAGIDDRGALLVKVGERIERLVGGEVHWHHQCS